MTNPDSQYESVSDKLLTSIAQTIVVLGIFWAIGQVFKFIFRMFLKVISACNTVVVEIVAFTLARIRGQQYKRVRVPVIEQAKPNVEFDGKGLFDTVIDTSGEYYTPPAKKYLT